MSFTRLGSVWMGMELKTMLLNDQVPAAYRDVSVKTANDLRTIATRVNFRDLSQLPLPEIERLSDEIARVVPAGNVPAMILGGLAKLRGRQVEASDAQKHLGLLFRGVRQSLDEAVFAAFFAGPAAVLYGYQQLLRLAGKDVDSAFPDGTWQFYLEFALREDSARHANETTGFHRKLAAHGLKLDVEGQLASWVMATVTFLRELPTSLANEWREPVALRLLADVAAAHGADGPAQFRVLHASWERTRPYQRGADAGQANYSAYRKQSFDAFLKPYLAQLPPAVQAEFARRFEEIAQHELLAYQRQLSWLAYLAPEPYKETRIPFRMEDAFIGVIWQGRYHLLPIAGLSDPEKVRAMVAAIVTSPADRPAATLDDALVDARRSAQVGLRQKLDSTTLQELENLRHTPVLLNWDERDPHQPLAMIRQGKRGVGDHPLTIFRTSESIVLDQSHIFFDGAWGAAVAEIMTNEALAWAQYFAQLPAATHVPGQWLQPALQASPALAERAQAVRLPAEASAETDAIQIRPILSLRKLLKQRSDLAQVTVNDLLVLYRGLHALSYQPSPELAQALDALGQDARSEVQQALVLFRELLKQLHSKNPAILIPIDARAASPRERLFPTTFRNPFTDFSTHHQQVLAALRAYKADTPGTRGATFQAFYEAQLPYLRLIAGFGELLSRYKDVALAGYSTSTTTIQLLGHLPTPLQKLLDTIPTKFDALNEILKGEEVFSNVGRVSRGSSLRRFITAKDDNQQKTFMWGVITDDNDIVRLSLRDFRPHVTVLHQAGRPDLAQQITQDYVDAYAHGLNQYVAELREITVASRETTFWAKDGKQEEPRNS